MEHITKAIPEKPYLLILEFKGGEVRILDMNPYIKNGGIWEKVKDWESFAEVRVQEDLGGLEWPSGPDFCPDTAYRVSRPHEFARDISQVLAEFLKDDKMRFCLDWLGVDLYADSQGSHTASHGCSP